MKDSTAHEGTTGGERGLYINPIDMVLRRWGEHPSNRRPVSRRLSPRQSSFFRLLVRLSDSQGWSAALFPRSEGEIFSRLSETFAPQCAHSSCSGVICGERPFNWWISVAYVVPCAGKQLDTVNRGQGGKSQTETSGRWLAALAVPVPPLFDLPLSAVRTPREGRDTCTAVALTRE